MVLSTMVALALCEKYWHSKYMKKALRDSTPTVPLEYAGKWIAWSSDHLRIVASAEHLEEVHRLVSENGETDVWYDKVPDATVRFGGAAFRR